MSAFEGKKGHESGLAGEALNRMMREVRKTTAGERRAPFGGTMGPRTLAAQESTPVLRFAQDDCAILWQIHGTSV